MRAIRVMWIDGQTRCGNGTAPAKLALRKTDGIYLWYCQNYNDAGIPSGECKIATGVSGATFREAIDAAWTSWGKCPWFLRTRRNGPIL
jgi:hypothetical protein